MAGIKTTECLGLQEAGRYQKIESYFKTQRSIPDQARSPQIAQGYGKTVNDTRRVLPATRQAETTSKPAAPPRTNRESNYQRGQHAA